MSTILPLKTADFEGHPSRVAVIIPSYKVRSQILPLLQAIGPEVDDIYVVDDACPEQSGDYVKRAIEENRISLKARITVLFHATNKGVGGAVITGYREALKDGCDIMVKLDGDGQMDPLLIPRIISPILTGQADYSKGNRFFDLESLLTMPKLRLFGNSCLSFINKVVSGYWNVMDPTNGYTAIHREALILLPLEKIDNRYFFESDMLFRLGTVRAVVSDVPMKAVYGDETSSLQISRVSIEFPRKFIGRFIKRIFYSYFLRDFNVCTLELLCGIPLFLFGLIFGAAHWYKAMMTLAPTPIGTIMLATLTIMVGFQLLLAVASFDITNIPRVPISKLLSEQSRTVQGLEERRAQQS